MNVLGHTLPVREMRDRQLVANDRRERRTEAPGFVDLRQHASLRLERGKDADGVFERRKLGVRGEREKNADAIAVLRDRLQLLGELQVEPAHARGVDEHELARTQGIEHVPEFT